jgi:glyoxylase-like metal-dependent hydrolase (beta-lactamase superfamily II)|uniref:N-acyl homoserine lactonase family protein n=1 Tax=Desulfobacca acetoxidans TaxID=60893 RepID=A0A7C3SHM5_9BACT
MPEYVIHPLVVGMSETDQGIMTYLKGYGKRIWIPSYVFYLEGGPEKILVDTGLEQFMVPEEVALQYGLEVLEFEDALAKYGLKPEDIDIIIHTHLHNDHCENDYKCVNAKVFVQKAEYEFFLNPHPVDHRYFPDLLDEVEVVTVEGDQEIVPGVSVMLTPGHTPGGQSVVVNTRKGKAIITGFCCNEQNFPASAPVVPPGVHLNLIQAYESIQRVKAAADLLIPLHDLSIGRHRSIPA